ncbi:hypothetical protein [Bradyrhizobium liaoningense]|uniref:hypothetical protein n=1 Tax=Bradyrhizobium liaoningense TaxID=43992 RepID=UPI00201351A7|nr:hypothetical protein [Bradyrhizobium liaoningense]
MIVVARGPRLRPCVTSVTLDRGGILSLYGTLHRGEPFAMLILFSLLTALPAVLSVHLLEPELVLPAFSILLFIEAGFAVIAARLIHLPDTADGITLWDLAGGFTLIGCAAAVFGEPDQAALFLTEQGDPRSASRP